MHPILLHLPIFGRVFELHAFGLMVALGCAAGTVLAVREAHRLGEDVERVRDLCLWGLAASLLGARLADVIANGRDVWNDCLDAAANGGALATLTACTRPLRPWEGGLVFYGGLIAGLSTIWFFTRRHGMDPARTMDLLTPSLPLGHALGRVGCLMAGCCWGKVAAVPWAISFPEGSAAFQEMAAAGALPDGALATPPLHPTQAYEAIGELGLFALLMMLRRNKRFDGQLALTWLVGYAGLRFVLELFRGDPSRAFFFTARTPGLARALGLPEDAPLILSTSQGIAIAVLAISIGLLVAKRRRLQAAAALTRQLNRSTEPPRAPAPAPRG